MNQLSKRQRRKRRKILLWSLFLFGICTLLGGMHYHNQKNTESYLEACNAFKTWELAFQLQTLDMDRSDKLPKIWVMRFHAPLLSINEQSAKRNYLGNMHFPVTRRSLPVSQGEELLRMEVVFGLGVNAKKTSMMTGFGRISWIATQDIVPDAGGELRLNAANCRVNLVGKIEINPGHYVEVMGDAVAPVIRYRPPIIREGRSSCGLSGFKLKSGKNSRGKDFENFKPEIPNTFIP